MQDGMEFCESCQVFQRPVLQGDKKICRRCGTPVPGKLPVSAPLPGPTNVAAPIPMVTVAVGGVIFLLLLLIVFLLFRPQVDPNAATAMRISKLENAQKPTVDSSRFLRDDIARLQRELSSVEGRFRDSNNDLKDRLLEIKKDHSEQLSEQSKSYEEKIKKLDAQLREMESTVKLMDRTHISQLQDEQEKKNKKALPKIKNALLTQAKALREENERKEAAKKAGSGRVIRDEEFQALMNDYKVRAKKVKEALVTDPKSAVPASPKAVDRALAALENEVAIDAPKKRPEQKTLPPVDTAVQKELEAQWLASLKETLPKRRQFVYKLLSNPQRRQAIPLFLKGLEDSDRIVRRFSYNGLKETTGKELPFDPTAGPQVRLSQIEAWNRAIATP